MRKSEINYAESETCEESDSPLPASDSPGVFDHRIGRLHERLKSAIGDRSTRAVAEQSGVSEGTVRNLLNGGIPKLDSLLRIADATEVRVGWLATGEGPMRPGEVPPAPSASQGMSQTQYPGLKKGDEVAFQAVNTGSYGVKAAVALTMAALGDHSQTIRPERLADLIDAAHQLLQAGADPELVRRLIAAAAQP